MPIARTSKSQAPSIGEKSAKNKIGICQYCHKEATVQCPTCGLRMCLKCGAAHERYYDVLMLPLP
jgi:hypothetical protein